MIWLTWRQFRTQTVVAAVGLAAFAVALLATRPAIEQSYRDSGLAACRTGCDSYATKFVNELQTTPAMSLFDLGRGLMFVVPVLIGLFWGAPLVSRELETGTFRLVWNQSVSRTRWLAVKLLGAGLVSMAVAGLLSLGVTWYAAPIDRAGDGRVGPLIFAARGVVPVGYAAFAFVLGVTVGVLVRRTVPAMAITLVLLAAIEIVVPYGLRAHLLPPVTTTRPLSTANLTELGMRAGGGEMFVRAAAEQPGAWVLSNDTVTPTGQPFTGPASPTFCGRDTPRECIRWIDTLGLKQVVTYQPASRFWPLQWYECGLYLAVALALAGFCFWWIRPRRR